MDKPSYPHSPGYKGISDTGVLAANMIAPKAKSIREGCLAVLANGSATAEQIAETLELHWMIVRARCSELRAQGLIEDTGLRGAGALGGKVIVWRLTTPEERALFNARKAAEAERCSHHANTLKQKGPSE